LRIEIELNSEGDCATKSVTLKKTILAWTQRLWNYVLLPFTIDLRDALHLYCSSGQKRYEWDCSIWKFLQCSIVLCKVGL